MSNSEQRLEGGGLSIRFLRQADRIGHEIWLADRGGWTRVLTSLEGNPQDDWPPSPPFQSLNVESRPGGRSVALLVGMAGKSHWSASIELDPAASSVHFDIACRVRSGSPGPLQSNYQTVQPADEILERRAVWTSGGLTLQCDEHDCPSRLSATHDEVGIAPSPSQLATPSNPTAVTLRWSYRVSAGRAK